MNTEGMALYDKMEGWDLPQAVVEWSFAEMRRRGEDGAEGIAFWAGRAEGAIARVSHAFIVRGRHVLCRRGILELESSLVNDLTDEVLTRGLYLIGQVHSHPPGASVRMSDTDQRYGIVAPSYLSVIVPDFAGGEWQKRSTWGVHVYGPARRWRTLPTTEALQRIAISEREAELVTIGEGPDA